MLLVPCTHCYTVVRVIGEPDLVNSLVGVNSEFWPDRYTCVTCSKNCLGVVEAEADAGDLVRMKVRDLTPNEMYAAQLGLGTPDEMQCDAATVRGLLGQGIKRVFGQDIRGTTRFCLVALEVQDGTTLHFGASPHGAVVFRISRPISYTQKALEETSHV